jgi:hypothetical protein
MQLRNNPLHIAEDDRLRSCYIRELVQDGVPINAPSGHVKIPKLIIQFWHDLAALPRDVRECLYSWEPLTTHGFKHVLIDDNEARAFISRRFGRRYVAAFDRCRHPAMRCDYFRLCYIYGQGGFYVDADEVYQGGDCQPLYRDNRLLLNVYHNPGDDGARMEYGYRGTPVLIDLGFDASETFHRYEIEWSPASIRWRVDGQLAYERVIWDPTPIPNLPMQLNVNLWHSRSEELAGQLADGELPAQTELRAIEILA